MRNKKKKRKKQTTKMNYVYYNANPFDLDTSDCAIRAISKFENISWEEAYKRLFRTSLKMKQTFANRQTIHTYLKETCDIFVVDIKFNDYVCPGKEELLALNDGEYYHMVYVCDNQYFDLSPSNDDWKIIEIYHKSRQTGEKE